MKHAYREFVRAFFNKTVKQKAAELILVAVFISQHGYRYQGDNFFFTFRTAHVWNEL